MKVLIIGSSYEPDLGPAAPLFTMLSKELVKLGHLVTVISTVPHYPSGQVPAAYRGKFFWHSTENNVEVFRIGLPSVNRLNLSLRFLQTIIYQLSSTIICISQRYDAVLACGPFLACLLPFILAVVLRRKPSVYLVHDLYPDVGIKLGVFKNKPVISVVTSLERFCLIHSSKIQIITDSFRPSLHKLGVKDSKIALIPLWVDITLIQPLPHDNSVAREYGLSGQFIVSYAGNIGRSQGLEYILSAAEILTSQKDIRFVFVGDGQGREQLQNQAKQRNLPNVQFIPFQPRERLPEVLACADISLVILRRGFGSDALPSKTFSIMASGRPVLVSVDEESESRKLMLQADAGIWVPPEDPSKLAEAILTLKHDNALRERLGHNGRNWVEKHHSPHVAAEQFEKLLIEAISYSKSRH